MLPTHVLGVLCVALPAKIGPYYDVMDGFSRCSPEETMGSSYMPSTWYRRCVSAVALECVGVE